MEVNAPNTEDGAEDGAEGGYDTAQLAGTAGLYDTATGGLYDNSEAGNASGYADVSAAADLDDVDLGDGSESESDL